MIAMPIALAAGTDAPRLAVRATDPLRRVALEHSLGAEDARVADVLVIDLLAGESLAAMNVNASQKVVLLTDDMTIGADLRVAAVLSRSASDRQIRAAAMAAAEGLLVRQPIPSQETRGLLTPREAEILSQVGQGLSNKSIARLLGISAHTVKYHLEAIFGKLGARSRAEAVSRGLRHGLLSS